MSAEIEASETNSYREYSEAIRAGQFIFVAGQCALDDDNEVVGVGDFEAQVRYTFGRIATILERFGATWSDVVRTSKIFKEMSPENVAAYQQVRRETMGPRFPVTIGVESNLFMPELLFEMEVLAVARE
jgi:enamine deaminase RidA (YjgF/YER057c/UK114 family)